MNLVLITSVINPPPNPLSYSSIRSVFTPEERFQQTTHTIASIREKIPDSRIFFLECSLLTKEQEEYITTHCDYFLNLFSNELSNNTTQKQLLDAIYGQSKSLGEGTMTIQALKYILETGIQFDNLYKISGRYYLNETFDYNTYDSSNSSCTAVFKKINGDSWNINTAFYKITNTQVPILLEFLIANLPRMHQCIGYEVLFADFTTLCQPHIQYIDNIGLSGRVTVDGSYYNG